MSQARTLTLAATAGGNEAAVVRAAALRLGQRLEAADPPAWSIGVQFEPDQLSPPAICLISLLALAEDADASWAALEARLRADVERLSASGAVVVLMTVLRYVEPSGDAAADRRRLVRIRRLNLLATKLSQEFQVFVADIDRDLANVGALHLQTDYRLNGAAAVDLAGWSLATCVLANALDGLTSFEAQDAALAAHLASKPASETQDEELPTSLMLLGKGRRRQRVASVTVEIQQDHVQKLVKQVMKGQIGLPEAGSRIMQAVRRRGARETVGLFLSAARSLVGMRTR